MRNLAVSDVDRETLRLTSLAADEQRQLAEGARQLLVALAELPEVQRLDAAECDPLAEEGWEQAGVYSRVETYDCIAGGMQPLPECILSRNPRAYPRAFVVHQAALRIL